MRVSFSLRAPATLSLAGSLTLAACSGTTTPFDPVALSQNADAVMNTMDSSQAMQSMSVLGPKMTTGAPAMGAASFLPAAATSLPMTSQGFPAWAAVQLAAFQRALPSFSVAAPNAVIIPALVLGKTFTYNVGSNSYGLSDATGAPATGVRFILYAINPISHTVATPLNPVGCADVTDESTSIASLKLHLKAYITGNGCTALNTPLIDYTAGATLTGLPPNAVTGATVTVSGFLSDGTRQLDFDLTQTYSSTTGISVDYNLSLPAADVSVEFQASYTLAGQATVTLTVKNAGNTTVATATGTQAAITGNITHDGDVVVNITGSASSPTFTSASGAALTDAQITALRHLFSFTDVLLIRVDEMLGPADALLGLSFVLA